MGDNLKLGTLNICPVNIMNLRLVIIWASLYAVLWTIVTVSLDPAVPYDAVEALNWAQNGEWGSPKNPWLVGLVMRPAVYLPANIYWYASHFLAIALGMVGSWVLAHRLTGSNMLAWFALLTLNLSGLINFDIVSYNDNYLLVMLWPWMMYCYLLAISRNLYWWLAFALLAGLATMSKYSTLILVGSVFLSTLFVADIRRCYRHAVWYCALALGVLLITPNILWLQEHNFAALHWVNSEMHPGINPGLFTCLLSIFYPLLISGAILYFCGTRLRWPASWERRVVLGVYLIPLTALCCWFFFFNSGRLTEWLQPFFILAPALMVSCVRQTSVIVPRSVFVSLFSAALLVLVGYCGVMYANVANAGQKMSGVIPFSDTVNRLWYQRYGTPLRYVGGERLAEWLTFYVPSRPKIITKWNNATQPNIYSADIRREQLLRDGVALIGRVGGSCSTERFGTALEEWPHIRIDIKMPVDFQTDSSHGVQTVCIAFVRPAGR